VNGAVLLRFPPASLQLLGLEVSPGHTCRLSWIELAFRLTQVTGKQELASVETVRRAITGSWYAREAARAALERPDWRRAAWSAGLLAVFDEPDEIGRAEAGCYLECFFLAVFTQPGRFQDLVDRRLQPEHVAGWAHTLSAEDLAGLAGAWDERRPGVDKDGVCRTLLASALDLYLQWSGQLVKPRAAAQAAEPDVVEIPARPPE
jgi:hypothetical protein